MKKIYLSGKYSRKYALVDDEDYEWLSKFRWFYLDGYAIRQKKIKGKISTFSMHREILGLTKEDKLQTDHINRNRLDNYKANLRICSQENNLHNVASKKNTSSKYKGVYKINNSWIANITVNGIRHYLGMYFDEKDAALAYDKAAREYFGEFAYLNFPEINDYSILGRRNPNLSSRYKGICFNKQQKKWVAQYNINGKRTRIGSYLTEEEANLARIDFMEKLNA